jgi:hypothetical protein
MGFEPTVSGVTSRRPLQTGPRRHSGEGESRTPRGVTPTRFRGELTCQCANLSMNGGRGIRTPVGVTRSGFQDRRLEPLGHSSLVDLAGIEPAASGTLPMSYRPVVEPARIELASLVCRTSVLPLNYGPMNRAAAPLHLPSPPCRRLDPEWNHGESNSDPRRARAVLSHLSYDPVGWATGIEPAYTRATTWRPLQKATPTMIRLRQS